MFYRANNSENSADNGCGYMMFADSADRIAHYGKVLWTYDGTDAVDVSDVILAAEKAGMEDETGVVATELNPSDIVNSAMAWDDMDTVMWVWENVCEPNGWLAIRTDDGAVVFDPALASRAN